MQDIIKRALSRGIKRVQEDCESRIVVAGVGGAGNNSIHRLANKCMSGAKLLAVNTDKQQLDLIPSNADKLLIGESITRGLGAGGDPRIGAKSADLSREKISNALGDADLLFLLAGMGGGTGTGASPIIARIAKEQGSVVVSVITFPFRLERARLQKARDGIIEMRKVSDAIVLLDNNKLLQLAPGLPVEQAFAVGDEIMSRAVTGVIETITRPSLINLDFSDIKALMTDAGISLISYGEGEGHNKIEQVTESTIRNNLLDAEITGGRGALIHITGGSKLTLSEAVSIGERLVDYLHPKANVIWGARMDPNLGDKVEVISVITNVKVNSDILSDRLSENTRDVKNLLEL